MELTFEHTMTFTDGSKTFIAHEPNNLLTEFFMANNRLGNKSAEPDLGEYDNLTFAAEPRRITPQPVKDFGIKTYPHLGSYGFYTPLYTPTSIVVIPINKEQNKSAMPQVVITDTGTTVHLDITGDYECYRVIVRLDYFATEFITYDTQFDFIPMYSGECTLTVIGHSNETAVTSVPFEKEVVLVDRT